MTLAELEQEITDAIELLAATAAVDRSKAARIVAVELGSRMLANMTAELERIIADISRAADQLEQLRAAGDRVKLAELAGKLELARTDAKILLETHAKAAAFVEQCAAELSPQVGAWLDALELDAKKGDPRL